VQQRQYTEGDEVFAIERVPMRQVPVEEFQDQAFEYLDAQETLAIERNG